MPRQPKRSPGEAYRRVLDTLAQARREGVSLEGPVRTNRTTISEVLRYARGAVTQRGGRWWPKPHDNLLRRMRFLTDRGYIAVATRDSRDATLIGEYNNAIRDYLQPPHPTQALERFEGLSIASDGKEYEFVTDPKTITRLARAGVIYFMDLYADGGF